MPLTVRTPTLEIAYEARGPEDGAPVILLHGFPDDPRAYDGVCLGHGGHPQAPAEGPNVPPALDSGRAGLVALGCRVYVPWLRGYGETRFLSAETPRSGQQAALGADLRDFIDALGIEQAVVGGYDWGGRAACIVAALWPQRVRGLVTVGGYNLQDIAASANPAPAAAEHRLWYQWYFHTERGRNGLEQNRRDVCRLLWRLWSPNYVFNDATFEATARSFDNPDFVDVVIQSYRHRHRAAEGDPALEPIEALLAEQPPITVPTISLVGEADGLGAPDGTDRHALHFTGRYERRIVPRAGHFLPREAPEAVVEAVRDLLG
ncbi:MAG TPA: alpha/beta hydrolase [Dehalococcoidia bacterium]|nr:alpha/beta hydrolase [Dehalococcoidia bacterium]